MGQKKQFPRTGGRSRPMATSPVLPHQPEVALAGQAKRPESPFVKREDVRSATGGGQRTRRRRLASSNPPRPTISAPEVSGTVAMLISLLVMTSGAT